MDGKQAIGAFLIGVGLLLFASAVLARTGATFAALIFGGSVLKDGAANG